MVTNGSKLAEQRTRGKKAKIQKSKENQVGNKR